MIQSSHLSLLLRVKFSRSKVEVAKKRRVLTPINTLLPHPRALQTVDLDPLVGQKMSIVGYDRHSCT